MYRQGCRSVSTLTRGGAGNYELCGYSEQTEVRVTVNALGFIYVNPHVRKGIIRGEEKKITRVRNMLWTSLLGKNCVLIA